MPRQLAPSALLLMALALLAAARPAWAAGFMVRETSAGAVAEAFAGNGSRADAADTAFTNPAGLPYLRGDEVEAGAALILPSVNFRGVARFKGAAISGDEGGDSGLTAAIPDFYATYRLSEDVTAGLAVTAPFGNANEYNADWYGRYLGLKTAARSIDINPSLGWRINDMFSVGGGVSAQYLKLDVTSAIDQAAIFGVPAPDALYRFQAHDWGYGFNLGLLAQLDDATRIGLTYRSAVSHDIKGTLDFTGASPLLGLVSGPAHASTRLPASTDLSLTSDVAPNLSVSADLQFDQWSSFKTVTIQSANPPFVNNENYRDSWMIALGAAYHLDPAWTLKAGLAWDQTPVVSRFRAVSLPDGDRYLIGLGAAYQWNDHTSLEGGYGHSFALDHPNMNASLNNTDPITHAVTLSGEYSVSVDILALSLRYKY